MRPRRRHADGQLAVLPRLVQLSQAQEPGGRADQAAGVLRIALDDLLEGLRPRPPACPAACRPRRAAARRRSCPGSSREHLAIERHRLGEAQLAGELRGVAVFLEHVHLVLRIGERVAGQRQRRVAAAADVAERRQALAILVGDRGRRARCGVLAMSVSSAVRIACRTCGRSAAIEVDSFGSRSRSYSSSRGARIKRYRASVSP